MGTHSSHDMSPLSAAMLQRPVENIQRFSHNIRESDRVLEALTNPERATVSERDNEGCRPPLSLHHLEPDAKTQLQGPGSYDRSEAQRSIGSGIASVHVKRGRARASRGNRESKVRTHYVVHAGKVVAVEEVERLGDQLQARPFSHFEPLGQAHVKVDVIRTKAGIAGGADWTIVGGMPVIIHVRACKQRERAAAVEAEDRGQLESAENPRPVRFAVPWCIEYPQVHNFVALIEGR